MSEKLNKTALAHFGEENRELIKDPSFLIRSLGEDDKQTRILSLALICDHSEIENHEKLSLCRQLISADPHEIVVLNAIDAIGRIAAGTFDENISKFLATYVLEPSNSIKNRCAAFWAIESILLAKKNFTKDQNPPQRIRELRSKLEAHNRKRRLRQVPNLNVIDWALVRAIAK